MAANGPDVGRVRPTILFELLELCADPHVELKGNNCLFKAAGTGHAEAVYVLLASGKFDAQALNDHGRSLADVAHRCHHELEMWLRDVWKVPCLAPPKNSCLFDSMLCFKVLCYASLGYLLYHH